jgi:hypothetical protein
MASDGYRVAQPILPSYAGSFRRKVKANSEVSPIISPAIPPAADDGAAHTNESRMPSFSETLAIFSRNFSWQISDGMPIDINADCHVVMRIRILKNQGRSAVFFSAIFGSSAANFLERVLVVRFSDNFNLERTRTLQIANWRLARRRSAPQNRPTNGDRSQKSD